MSLLQNLVQTNDFTALADLDTPPPSGAFERWRAELRANDDDDLRSISLYGPIGPSFDDGPDNTIKRVGAALRSIGPGPVVVNVNSPGGSFFEGNGIYNLLRAHRGAVTVRILSIAASAASLIAMAGDAIEIADSAFMMIHNTQGVAMGDRHALSASADFMAPFDASMRDVYSARSGIEARDVEAMMDRETIFNASKAIESGFATDTMAPGAVTALAADAAETVGARARLQEVESLLAHAGCSRRRRRELIAAMTQSNPDHESSDMPSAVNPVTPSADLPQTADIRRLIETIKA